MMNTERYATINQETRHPTQTSADYRFLSTKEALTVLADHGWHPARIHEAGVRKPQNWGFQKHLIRLQNPAYSQSVGVIARATPEIVLKNAHNGDSALRLFGGIFELVCSNGLIVWEEFAEARRLTHRSGTAAKMAEAIRSVVASIPVAFETRERWRDITLSRDEQLTYAEAIIPMVFDGDAYTVDPRDLLIGRHFTQGDPTLWNTFNRVQENVIRGGVRRTRRDGSRIRSRVIKDVDENVRINRALWRVAGELERALN